VQKYIGVKIIEAEPKTNVEVHTEKIKATKIISGEKEGYRVVYPDGYISWSPKEAFDEAYRPIDGLPFGLAVEAMKKGLKVRLPWWSKDVFISIDPSKMTAPYILRSEHAPWNPAQVELLSEKWTVVE